MTEKPLSRSDSLLAELELHKAEFVALRDEILHSIDADRQSLNLTLVAIGAGLGLIPFISTPSLYVILLFLPFVFHIILGDMLNNVRSIGRISDYLTETLIPRANAILDELGNSRHATIALGWEIYIYNVFASRSNVILGSLTPTRYWMPVLAIAALLVAYGVVVNSSRYTPTLAEAGLLFINLLLLIFVGIQNAVIARDTAVKANRLKRDGASSDQAVNSPPVQGEQRKKRKK